MALSAWFLGTLFLTVRRSFRWLYSRFTTPGLCLLIGMLTSLGTASTDRTMGMSVFLLLLAMLLLALLLAPFFRSRFAVARRLPRLVTAGAPFIAQVRLTNLTARPQRGLEYREELRDRRLPATVVFARLRQGGALARGVFQPRSRLVEMPTLPAGGSVDLDVELIAYRRGVLQIRGGVVARTDPFGLFRAFVRLAAPDTVLVMPQRYPVPALALPGRSQYQAGGVALAAGVGESEEFVALRDYRRGDPLKRVHWRSAAHTGKLVVKEYQDEYLVRHALVFDTACPARGESLFEEAVAVAASFACTIPDQESLLDLLVVGRTTVQVTSGRGVGHTQQMLEVLAAVEPQADPAIDVLESQLLAHRPTLSGCVLVLTLWDAPRRAMLRRLGATGLPLLVLLVVPEGTTALPATTDDAEPLPARTVLLVAGRIGDGLRQLESAA
jgi:uncharacterized protein (DUF58 family)